MSPHVLDNSVSAPGDTQRQADHADDLELGADPAEHPREHLEQQAHQRSENQDRHEESDPPVDALALPHEVEGEGRNRGDRAVREVEDTGGLVREHQTGAGEAVDGPGGQTDDDERKQVVHAADTPHFVRRAHEPP